MTTTSERTATTPFGDLAAALRGELIMPGDPGYDQARAVYGLAVRVTANAEAAKDVTQEVFTELWCNPMAFDPGRGTLRAWLAMLAHRRAVDWVRREVRRRRLTEAPVAYDCRSTVEEDVVTAEVARCVRRVVEELPPPLRDVVLARFTSSDAALLRREVRLAGTRPVRDTARSALVQRAFETWIHADDIRTALGRAAEPPSPHHLRLIADLGASLLPRFRVRHTLVGAVGRVSEIGGGRRGERVQHRGFPRQQRTLGVQAPQRVRLCEQGLLMRQINRHHRGHQVRKPGGLAGQIRSADLAGLGDPPPGERVEIAAEPLPHGLGHGPRGRLVTDVLGELFHLGPQIRQRVVNPHKPEPACADAHQVELAVVVLRYLPQRRRAADVVKR
jgi:RNA polymerase sigma factor (sigma-70 family)